MARPATAKHFRKRLIASYDMNLPLGPSDSLLNSTSTFSDYVAGNGMGPARTSAGCCVLYQGHCLRLSLRIAAFADPCIFWLQISRAPRLQHPTVMVVNSNDNVQLPPKLRKLRAISFRGHPAAHFIVAATLHFAVQS